MEAVLEEPQEEPKQLTKSQKFWFIVGGVLVGIVLLVILVSANNSERRRKREKLRHFKPSYRGGFWGTYTDWTEREVPLTDEELSEALKKQKLIG